MSAELEVVPRAGEPALPLDAAVLELVDDPPRGNAGIGREVQLFAGRFFLYVGILVTCIAGLGILAGAAYPVLLVLLFLADPTAAGSKRD